VRLFGGTEAAAAAALTAAETAAQADVLARYAWVFGALGTGVLLVVLWSMLGEGGGAQRHSALAEQCWPTRRGKPSRRTAPEEPRLQLTRPIQEEEEEEEEAEGGEGGVQQRGVVGLMGSSSSEEQEQLSGPVPTTTPAAAGAEAARRASPSRKGRSKLVVKYDSRGLPLMTNSRTLASESRDAPPDAPNPNLNPNAPSPSSGGGLPPLRMDLDYADYNASNAAMQRPRRKLRMNPDGSGNGM
jgi:hypothetical protein